MGKTKIFSMMWAVLAIAISIGFTSCKDKEKEPEGPDLSCEELMGKWTKWVNHGVYEPFHFLEFKPNNAYSYVIANENINGIYKVTEKEKGTYEISIDPGDGTEHFDKRDFTLYKMLASGSNIYDRMFVYFQPGSSFPGPSRPPYIYIQLYSGDNLVQNLRWFEKQN